MTTAELAKLLNRTATIDHDGLSVRVRILDGRQAYGREDVLVTPLEGSGERWVSAERVRLEGG